LNQHHFVKKAHCFATSCIQERNVYLTVRSICWCYTKTKQC